MLCGGSRRLPTDALGPSDLFCSSRRTHREAPVIVRQVAGVGEVAQLKRLVWCIEPHTVEREQAEALETVAAIGFRCASLWD